MESLDPKDTSDRNETVDPNMETQLNEARVEAVNGSEKHQVFLGKHYLNQAEAGINQEEYGKIAVDWLIKASKQGNDEATALLTKCLDCDIGITPANEEDVQWCLNTTNLEKNARQAAKQVFRRLNPLHTNQISRQDYLDAIGKMGFNKEERKLLEKAGKSKDSDMISEDAFADKIVSRLHGSGGTTLGTLLRKEEGETFQNASYARKIFYYPGKSLMKIADSSIEVASKQGMTWLKSLIPTQQIHMLMVFFLYSVLSIHFFFKVIPLFVFFFSLLAMIICTLQMFYGKRKLKDVEAIAQMLNRFNETLDTDNAVSSYTWNSLTPYISFFIALFVCLVSFSLAEKSWVPCSEIVCVGMFFAMTCFAALSDQYDHLVILSIVANFISTLPTMLADFPQIPVIYHLLQLFGGSVISISIIPDVVVNFGLPSMVYMVVPVLFIKMALQKSGQGVYRVLVPHLVCFFWWQFAMVMFKHSSWIGLIRGSLGWIMLIALAPVLFFLVILYSFYYFAQVFTIAGILKLFTTLILLAIPAALGFWVKKGFNIKGFSFQNTSGKVVLVILSVFSVIPLMYFIAPQELVVSGEYLPWEQYAKHCSKPSWDQSSIANTQIKCSHLQNIMVDWPAVVKKVTISKVENGGESFVNLLPNILADWLRCTYGEEYPPCDTLEDPNDRELCEMYTIQGRNCHMRAMDYYKFDLWVTKEVDAETTQDFRIEATNSYRNILLKLKAGDAVSFRAALVGGFGDAFPKLKLYHIECTTCGESLMSTDAEEADELGPIAILFYIRDAIYDTLNFFFAPVVEFSAYHH